MEALAEAGKLYTLRQSFNSMMETSSATEQMIIDEVGVNQAGVFDGFCPAHDARGFASVERLNEPHKFAMIGPLNFRAHALEYCRKRRNADFFRRLAELTTDGAIKAYFADIAERYERTCLHFGDRFIGAPARVAWGDPVAAAKTKVEFFCLPVAKNLEVSCCGCFHLDKSNEDSIVAYNLISYADMSILLLTTSTSSKDRFYEFAHQNPEKLLNEIAFSKCEEPLIGAKLWRSLGEDQKLAIRLSLCHPDVRVSTKVPQVIKLEQGDTFGEVTPELWQRLRLFDNPKSPTARR